MNYVYGSVGDDNLISSHTPGSDTVFGLYGTDVLWGGKGKDIFVVYSEDVKEFIADFEDGRDLVDLRDVGVATYDQLVELYEYETDIVETSVSRMRLYLTSYDGLEARVDIDPTDFILTTTPVYDYSGGRDNVTLNENVYSVHFGHGGYNLMSLTDLDTGPRNQGAEIMMDRGREGSGKFELDGVTQHFFDFRSFIGTSGRDHIVADGQKNMIAGRTGSDVILGRGGDDFLRGNGGSDRLHGQTGDDRLEGGRGLDRLTGGTGDDVFIFNANDNRTDIVRDFGLGADRLDVSDWGVESRSELSITQNDDGSLTVAHGDVSFIVRDHAGDDLASWQLGAEDFIFA